MWNRAFFQKVLVRDGRIADNEYEQPFTSLLGFTQGSNCGPEGSRTPDLCPAEAALYQLSYRPAVSRL
jgi:hypothetical protein